MAKKRRGRVPPRNHIGEWIAYRNKRQSAVAKAAGIGESYLSLIVANEKPNPGISILLDISKALDCTVNDLFRHPPEHDVGDAGVAVTPELLRLLGGLKDALKKPTEE